MTSTLLKLPPTIHRLLGNGRFHTLITAAGTGCSRMGDCALTRWSGDELEDSDGYFVYLRDLDSGDFWPLSFQPGGTRRAAHTELDAGSDAGTFWLQSTAFDIAAFMDIVVSPDHDLELRRVTLHNPSRRTRRIELTSYLEVVLNTLAAEAAHPAFSKLFVQTEHVAEKGALLAHRRPRGADEKGLWMVHAASGGDDAQFETDRARFIGRGRDLGSPAALAKDARLSGTAGNVLDAALSLRRSVVIAPGDTARVVFLLGARADRAGALALVAHGASDKAVDAVFSRAAAAVTSWPAATVDPSEARGPALPGDLQPLQFFNGHGGFSSDGGEYVVRMPWSREQGLHRPPLPWTNAISNERFGFLVSESGAGTTWSRNSREHRITPWSNDPVCDPHGEALYVRDEESGEFWSPTPGPAPANAGYEATHGFGVTRFRHESHGFLQETTMFVPRHEPVKIVKLRLTNRSATSRSVSVFACRHLVLGATPVQHSRFVRTEHDAESDVLFAVNPKAGEFADGVVFSTLIAPLATSVHHSGNRAGFIGRHGSPSRPVALLESELDGVTGSGLDPCAAHQARLRLAPGQAIDCIVLLGETTSRDDALALVQRLRHPGAIDAALDEVKAFWRDTLSAVQVKTPLPEVDLMLNGWLPYQNLACRMWGRSAFYQSGGALGYRDQLQDAAAMIYARPDLTRAQIRLHAAHQFVEGDVLHWWHSAPLEKGLRTRFSDDLLWLPYVTAFYVRTTGDAGVLNEVEPFLRAPLLDDGEDEVFLQPELSGESGDVYEHCCRALDRSLTLGVNGLPLMGTGDWNDGMNRVGREGRGESVWMGFFLHRIILDFLPLCEHRGDTARVERYRQHRDHLHAALNTAGWDGDWYRRGYYDNGAVIGSRLSDECQIDALAQAWAVISDVASPERAAQAMDAVEQRLISDRDGLIRLLTPPFVDTPNDPGYIKGYVAGVRENGGQYTHAACWVVRAMAEMGRHGRAAELLRMLSPVSHSASPEAVETYKVEPYVIAADIYGEAPHVGRGGWTWYTGSAGWMFRVALESVLGFTIEGGNTMVLRPRIPDGWPGYTMSYRRPGSSTRYDIHVGNPDGQAGAVRAAAVDGVPLPLPARSGGVNIPMVDDGASHRVELVLGAAN